MGDDREAADVSYLTAAASGETLQSQMVILDQPQEVIAKDVRRHAEY